MESPYFIKMQESLSQGQDGSRQRTGLGWYKIGHRTRWEQTHPHFSFMDPSHLEDSLGAQLPLCRNEGCWSQGQSCRCAELGLLSQEAVIRLHIKLSGWSDVVEERFVVCSEFLRGETQQ